MSRETPQLLLIEDDETLAEITSFRLELLGYDVKYVHSDDEALKFVEEKIPDLIIIDLAIPGMGGLEVINQLKNNHQTNNIAILAFSTQAELDKVQEAYLAGADDYLITPYDPAVLQKKIELLLKSTEHVRGR